MKTPTIKLIHEKVQPKEVYDTKVTIYVEGTDTILFQSKNKIIVPGAINTACKHWGLQSPIILPNYNTELGITADGIDLSASVDENNKFISLFCVGTGGCGPESSQVYTVDFAKWIKANEIVPFQYRHKNDDLTPAEREVYFGRKEIGDYIAYYFKAFHTAPELKMQYIDGTPITSEIYNTDSDLPVEVFVETKMKVDKTDVKDYFERTVGLNEANVSTLSLLTGFPVTSADGYTYYKDVQPMTKYNFSLKKLDDVITGLDITYDIYY